MMCQKGDVKHISYSVPPIMQCHIKTYLKELKLRLKNTIIDKMLTYASGTWILTKRDRKQNKYF